jgi:hypothetical protein
VRANVIASYLGPRARDRDGLQREQHPPREVRVAVGGEADVRVQLVAEGDRAEDPLGTGRACLHRRGDRGGRRRDRIALRAVDEDQPVVV